MNKENLDKIINNYIQDIPNIYDTEHDELFKWRAVKHFQDNWNIDAEDFVKMLKEAMSETSIFVNNASVLPLNGLIKLAEIEPAVVKEMFKILYDCNSKPISERNLIIDECLKMIDNKIEEHFGDSWKFRQNRRTIIFYMTIMNPDENYFYKSNEAMSMANCIEYADLANGSHFRLESYYNMCEQIKEHIKSNTDLITIHSSYLNDKCWEDKNLNLLVFNIIYSSKVYGYYDKNGIDLKKKYLSTKDKVIKDAIEKRKIKEEELISARKAMADVMDYLDNLGEIFEIGVEVSHIKFGHGKIVGQTISTIEVEFDNGEIKKLGIPTVFLGDNPIVTTKEHKVIKACMDLEDKLKEKSKLESKIKILEHDINNLDKIIGID